MEGIALARGVAFGKTAYNPDALNGLDESIQVVDIGIDKIFFF